MTVMSELVEIGLKPVAWINVVWRPTMRLIRTAAARHRDFDFATTALLPSVFLALGTALASYFIWAPHAGIDGAALWIEYHPWESVLLLVAVLAAAVVISAVLFLVGHRALLALWSALPLRRDPYSEIPVVDREGLVSRFAAFQRRFRLYDRYAAAQPWSRVERFLQVSLNAKPLPDELDPSATQKTSAFLEELRAAVTDLATQVHDVAVSARRLAIGPQAQASERGQGRSPANGPVRISPDAETVGEAVERMLDGLRPDFVAENEKLVSLVLGLQRGMRERLDELFSKFDTGEVAACHLSAVKQIVQDLAGVSRDLAWQMALAFGVNGPAWTSYVRAQHESRESRWRRRRARLQRFLSFAGMPDALLVAESGTTRPGTTTHYGLGRRRRTFANALAFNLEWTTLGRWSHWHPLDQYDWKTGARGISSKPVDEGDVAQPVAAARHQAVEIAPPKVRAISSRVKPWRRRAAVEEAIERSLASMERAEKERARTKAKLDKELRVKAAQHEEQVRAKTALVEQAIRIHRLQAARSKILSFVTLATFAAFVAIVSGMAVFRGFEVPTVDRLIAKAALSVAIVVAVIVVTALVFVRPVVNHAFYVCLGENRLRQAGQTGSEPRPPSFDWTVPMTWPAYLLRCAFLAAVTIGLLISGHVAVVMAGGLDYRLVVAAAQPLDKGDGITPRNLKDVVELKWRRCEPEWAKRQLTNPDDLRDTFLIAACDAADHVYVRPDLVVRSSSARTPALPAEKGTGCDLAGPLAEIIAMREGSRIKSAAMCRTSVNRPPEPGPSWLVKSFQSAGDAARTLRHLIDRLPKLIPRPVPQALYVGNMSVLAEKATVEGPERQSPVVVYVERPAAQTVHSTTVYAVLDGRSGQPQRTTLVGSVHFNFNCDGNQPQHCPVTEDCPAGEKLASQEENDKSIRALIAEAATLEARDRNLLIIGLTDRPGASDFNKRLSLRRADYVRSRILENTAEKDRAKVSALVHPMGIGEGGPAGKEQCDATRRRVDVYAVDAKRDGTAPQRTAAAP
jgi:hypothetical protein